MPRGARSLSNIVAAVLLVFLATVMAGWAYTSMSTSIPKGPAHLTVEVVGARAYWVGDHIALELDFRNNMETPATVRVTGASVYRGGASYTLALEAGSDTAVVPGGSRGGTSMILAADPALVPPGSPGLVLVTFTWGPGYTAYHLVPLPPG